MGTHVHLWWIHVNVWQNQYSIVKQNKVKQNKTTTTTTKNVKKKKEGPGLGKEVGKRIW